MIKIALITEGVTDQFIIKPIIENYFKNIDFGFRPIQPPVDETDKQTDFGSWTNVITELKKNNLPDLFDYNDFVVIQIDSDISQEKGFDVPHLSEGKQISNKQLCENVINKLQSFIPVEILEEYSNKILFAIGVQTMECWLVRIVDSNYKNTQSNNCLERLNRNLSKQNMNIVNPKTKNNYQSRTTYKKLAKEFKNKSTITRYSKSNVGFECFVKQIENINIST